VPPHYRFGRGADCEVTALQLQKLAITAVRDLHPSERNAQFSPVSEPQQRAARIVRASFTTRRILCRGCLQGMRLLEVDMAEKRPARLVRASHHDLPLGAAKGELCSASEVDADYFSALPICLHYADHRASVHRHCIHREELRHLL
jgi:hypothetical protein